MLNKNDANISEADRQRVLECAKKLDYRTNMAAKGLVTGQSKMIGLIVPELFHGFFGEVAAGVSDALTQQGYGLIIASSRDDEELESKEIMQMLARSVDALVVASCGSEGKRYPIRQSRGAHGPVGPARGIAGTSGWSVPTICRWGNWRRST